MLKDIHQHFYKCKIKLDIQQISINSIIEFGSKFSFDKLIILE